MENNVFYVNRKVIGEIGRTRGVDVGVATDMFINEEKPEYTSKDRTNWNNLLRDYQLHKTKHLGMLFDDDDSNDIALPKTKKEEKGC